VKLKIISLYSFLDDCYNNILCHHCQRFSNNTAVKFTDVELLTCYFFAVLEEEKTQVSKIYGYIAKYWRSWFPDLPSYQAFNSRLNRLSDVLPLLIEVLLCYNADLHINDGDDYCIDSFPIMLCKGNRYGKVARNISTKTYSKTKGVYYYGVKMHCLVQNRPNSLPMPKWVGVTAATVHDITVFKELLPSMTAVNVFGDKAYLSKEAAALCEERNIRLLCPPKRKKGETEWERQYNEAYISFWGKAVSRTRQTVEVFFSWLIEKVNIQNASKVRSEKGLMVHAFGKFASALFILMGF